MVNLALGEGDDVAGSSVQNVSTNNIHKVSISKLILSVLTKQKQLYVKVSHLKFNTLFTKQKICRATAGNF